MAHLAAAKGFEPTIRWMCEVASTAVRRETGLDANDIVSNSLELYLVPCNECHEMIVEDWGYKDEILLRTCSFRGPWTKVIAQGAEDGSSVG